MSVSTERSSDVENMIAVHIGIFGKIDEAHGLKRA